jgi:hypothetical protein
MLNLVLKVHSPLPLVKKSEFAKAINVSVPRMSQYLSEGKIDGAAVVGEGQRALIDFDIALAQLKERLSVNERFGLNGLDTNLEPAEPVPDPAAPPPTRGLAVRVIESVCQRRSKIASLSGAKMHQ